MKKALIIALVAVAVGVAYYGLSPLFRNVEVNDEVPASMQGDVQGEQSYTVRGPYEVQGTAGHPASGSVSVYESGDSTFVRYENFKTINGPLLHVYLAKDKDAKEYIDLGAIRGTEGSINYELPEGVDLSEYPYVMYWCVPFGVLFNYAYLGDG